MRVEAAKALATLGDTTRTAAPLIEALSDASGDVRTRAAITLGELRIASAVPHLFQLMREIVVRSDETPLPNRLFTALMYALSVLGDRRIEPIILDSVRDPALYERASNALHRIGGPESVDFLIRILNWARDRGDFWVAFASANALGRIGERKAITPLIKSLVLYDGLILDVELPPGPYDALIAMGERAFKPLHRALRNGSLIIRREAVMILSWSEGDPAIPAIARLLKDKDEDVRNSTITALSNIGGSSVIPHMAAALNDRSARIRLKAIEYTRNNADSTVKESIRKSLSDTNGKIRALAAATAGELKDRYSVPILMNLARNDTIDVRKAAIRSLGNIGDDRALPLLREIMEKQDNQARDEAVIAYLKLRPVLDDITDVCVVDSFSVKTRLAIGSVLYRIGDPQGIHMLEYVLQDPNPYIRKDALDSLVSINPDHAVEYVISATSDSQEKVLSAAINHLNNMGTNRSKEALDDLINRAIHSNDTKLMSSLSVTEDPRLYEHLVTAFEKAYSDRNDKSIGSSMWGLGRLGDHRALEYIIPFVYQWQYQNIRGDSDFWIYYILCSTLGELGGQKAIDALEYLMDICWGEYGLSVVGALEKIGPPDAVPILRKALNSYDTFARQEAAKTLRTWGYKLRPD